MFTIENTVKDVTLSQIGCDSHEGGLVDDRQWSIRQRLPQVVWRIRSGSHPTVQSDSEARTEEHSKITENDKSGWELEIT